MTYLLRWIQVQQAHFQRQTSQRPIQAQLIHDLCLESKKISSWLCLEGIKNKQGLLTDLKDHLIRSLKTVAPSAVALTFSLLEAVAEGIKGNFASVFTSEDLLKNETTLYSTLWTITSLDQTAYFTPFLVYMRKHSVSSILSLHNTLDGTPLVPSETMLSFEEQVHNHDPQVFRHFHLRPVELSKLTVEHYLRQSGISFPLSSRLLPKKRFAPVTPPTYDPMHFLMVQSVYWNHPFHRRVLDLALWVSLDCYTKWAS